MAELHRLWWLIRPRFSLWAMLVLVTVIAIPLSYVAQRMTTARVVEQPTRRPTV